MRLCSHQWEYFASGVLPRGRFHHWRQLFPQYHSQHCPEGFGVCLKPCGIWHCNHRGRGSSTKVASTPSSVGSLCWIKSILWMKWVFPFAAGKVWLNPYLDSGFMLLGLTHCCTATASLRSYLWQLVPCFLSLTYFLHKGVLHHSPTAEGAIGFC